MNWFTKWFIDNPVGANLLMLAIIAAGLLSAKSLRIESFPQVAPSSLVIQIAYPGGTAKQIDQSITQRVEEAISGVAGIKQITSNSSAGLSTIRVRKTSSTNLNRLLEDVRNQVNSIASFPVQAEKPQITRDEFTNLAAFVVVSGDRQDKELQPIARQVELALKKHPKIAKVSNWGSRQPLLIIEPDINKLKNIGLSLAQVAEKIEQRSLEAKSGELKSSQGRVVLRGDGYADNIQTLTNLAILSTPTGSVHLGDIATITRDYEDSGAIVRNNGKTAIALLVSTAQQDNLLHVSDAITSVINAQQAQLPADITLSTMADMAPYIKDQLNRLSNNAWQGLLIVLILLGLFLEIRLAFWVAIGIPISLCGTLAAMNVFNFSINDITLFGFILVLGILVDDAVVVGESIHSERRKGVPPKEAAWKGVKSVSVATVFGVLTTIAAFSPMLWINNDFAKVLAGFSAVVIMALTFSLIESKLILPSHLASSKGRSPKWLSNIQQTAQNQLQTFVDHIYAPVLKRAINNKTATLLGFAAFIVLAYGLWAKGFIRSAIFPDIPGRYVTAKIDLEDSAPLPLQEKALTQVEKAAITINESMQHTFQLTTPPLANLLAWSDGYGEIEITAELTSEALSQLPSGALISQWRKQAGEIEGAYSVRYSSTESPAGGSALTVSALDRDMAILATKTLSKKLAQLPGVSDIYDDGKGGQEQIRLRLNEFGRQLGLTRHQLAKLAGDAFGQREIHRILDQGQETKLILRYSEQQKRSEEQLIHTPIFLGGGKTVLLGDVAELHFEREPDVLYRRNREQVINLYWNQDRKIQAPEMTLAQLSPIMKELKQQFPAVTIREAGEFEEIGEVQEGFKQAMIFTLLLIYILLAVPLKSYWQPLIIMAVIPFGFAGAIFGHGIMGLPVSILSLFGMMAMTGIVINDSLVLITRFNDFYRSGMPLKDALIQSATNRFKAVFLTTVTTVCGLLPLLSESAEQAQYLKPAAVSLVFGELFATSITLIIIPVLLGCVTKTKQQASVSHTEIHRHNEPSALKA